MAIYSLQHSSIGRTTHAAGTAGAHVMYISRFSASRCVFSEIIPNQPEDAKAWLDEQEMGDRKNARVVDKIMVAFPRELDGAARCRLVTHFVHEIIGGEHQVPWLAAFHDKGEDCHNPHAHIVIRDRSPKTGKRVVELSSKGSTERVREIWERLANEALKEQGLEVQIDRRSLKEQGIERVPQIHEGVTARVLEKKNIRPESQLRIQQGFNGQEREIRYTEIDQNQTRVEHNAKIISLNIYNELPDTTQELRRMFDIKAYEHEKIIIKRAEKLAMKIEVAAKQQEGLKLAHDSEKPVPPRFLVIFREEAYKKRLEKWLKIAERLAAHYRRLLRRLERVIGYNGSGDVRFRKSRQLAEAQVKKKFPELTLKLSKYHDIDRNKEWKEIDLQIKRQRQHEKDLGRDRGLSL